MSEELVKDRAVVAFGPLKDAFVSMGDGRGLSRGVRIHAYTNEPDLQIAFQLTVEKGEELGRALLKYAAEWRERMAGSTKP